ncbi:MAG: hypothetical protein Q8N63_03620 [Nanoarchaeota archaeon]|nr:hypothetical protein [Nanoarchaeota archaeon]
MTKKGVLELDANLCDRVIRLSATDSDLRISSNLSDNKTKLGLEISVLYHRDDENSKFIEIDTIKKKAHFSDYPKSYSTEIGCAYLVSYLKDEGYKIDGLTSFLESPMFKKNEVSLF